MIRNVKDAPVTVEEQSADSFETSRTGTGFFSFGDGGVCESIIFVVTFLAVLELCRNGKIVVVVKEGHDDFWMAVRDGA